MCVTGKRAVKKLQLQVRNWQDDGNIAPGMCGFCEVSLMWSLHGLDWYPPRRGLATNEPGIGALAAAAAVSLCSF
jgi:hypothetical protein